MNFLEQVAAEWFTYTGHFVRTNIKLNPRPNGGYDNEIDILAYQPETRELIHAEPSSDANSWEERKTKYLTKKFVFSDDQYSILIGKAKVNKLRKLAITGFGKSSKSSLDWGNGIEVVLIPSFIMKITEVLSEKSPLKEAVPEGFPILRGMQFALHYRSA